MDAKSAVTDPARAAAEAIRREWFNPHLTEGIIRQHYAPLLAEMAAEVERLRKLISDPIDDDACCLRGDYRTGLFCGVEDCNLQADGYGAAEYGFNDGVERAAEYFKAALANRQPGENHAD